jgi:polyphosphate kinase
LKSVRATIIPIAPATTNAADPRRNARSISTAENEDRDLGDERLEDASVFAIRQHVGGRGSRSTTAELVTPPKTGEPRAHAHCAPVRSHTPCMPDTDPAETTAATLDPDDTSAEAARAEPKLKKKVYEDELARLQLELVKMEDWVKAKGLRVVVLFEGRDAAGKGGVIKRIMDGVNPRICRVVALAAPTEREKGQWYFQRYVQQLPSAGEIALFDRSWYNRAGVERVMGFATPEEVAEFMRACPEFERMLIRSGTILVKYWFSVSDEEQERRFQARINDPAKSWKLSPMDLEARSRWVEFSKAKDEMFRHTDTEDSPWWVVESDDKRRAHLNCITHLLSRVPYEDLPDQKLVLPPRQSDDGYVRPPRSTQRYVPEVW